jgi:hypothetical protein
MFTNKSRNLSFTTSTTDGNCPSAFGTVLEIKKNRCKVRLFSGEDIESVRLPGGYPQKTGKAHGVFGGISVKQLVLVEFGYGTSQNPIIVQSYPFMSRKQDSENYKLFSSIHDIKTTDIVIFHESGYSVWLTDNKIIVKKEVVSVLTLDLQTMSIDTTMLGMTLGTVSVSNGDVLNTFLQSIITHLTTLNLRIDTIQTALQTSPTVIGDGGSSYKAGITTALASNTLPIPPVVPVNLNNTNLKIAST